MTQFKTLLNLAGDHLYTLPLLVLYLTDGCNSRCATCDIWRNPRRNMPPALVDALVESARRLHTAWVLLSGGEAMQHPEWPAIARRFRASGTHVMLLTNGLLLRKQAQQVIDSVDEVIVSLDAGDAPTYAAIRGVDAFDLILEGIAAVRAGGLPVTTRTTIQSANFRQMPAIIDQAQAAGATLVSFLAVDVSNPFAFGSRFTPALPPDTIPLLPAQPAAGALSPAEVDELALLLDALERDYAAAFAAGRIAESPQKLRRILLHYFRALHGQGDWPRPPCNAPHFSTVVEVDGTLRPCYFLPAYDRLKPGAADLPQALNGAEARRLRHAYRTGQRPECARCVCPLYKGARQLLSLS
ncbi:MAG: radical SAM protein [Anaerolineae bacterium]|jgi:MoaA/NifB/PqqE/SkfB family radical SAM enzyme|nr:radical SAM protein [Anaerolineae bacterium]